MRNFKKFLALVLAMLMVSACAVSVSAFTDQAAVDASDYKVAIEMLADFGVLKGDENGVFNPDGTLLREQAAVVAAKVLAGAKAIDWTDATTRFTDVTDTWSFAYINYVDDEGVMYGKGGDIFDPKANLTIAEALKIAVAIADPAAARKAELEYAKNPSLGWAAHFIDAADTLGLTEAVTIRKYDIPCTREMFAQFIYNAFDFVPEEKVTEENPGDKFGLQENFGYDYAEGVVSYNADAAIVTIDGKQIAGALFNEALKEAGYTETAADLDAQNSKVYISWMKSGKNIVILALDVLTTGKVVKYNSTDIKVENVYDCLDNDGKYDDLNKKYIKINGVKYEVGATDGVDENKTVLGGADVETVGITVTIDGVEVAKYDTTSDTTKAATGLNTLPKYFEAFLYDDNGDGDYERCDIVEYVIATIAKVAATADNSFKQDLYTVNFKNDMGSRPVNVHIDNDTAKAAAAKFSGETFTADDEWPVLVAKKWNTGDTVDILEIATPVIGQLTSIIPATPSTPSSVVIDEKPYKFNEFAFNVPASTSLKQTITVYTINGELVNVTDASFVDKTIVLDKASVNADGNVVLTGFDATTFAAVEYKLAGQLVDGKYVAVAGHYGNKDGKNETAVFLGGSKNADGTWKETTGIMFVEGTYYDIDVTTDGCYYEATQKVGTADKNLDNAFTTELSTYQKFSVDASYIYVGGIATYYNNKTVVIIPETYTGTNAYGLTYKIQTAFAEATDVVAYTDVIDSSKVAYVYVADAGTAKFDTIKNIGEGQTIVQALGSYIAADFDYYTYEVVDLLANKKDTVKSATKLVAGQFYLVKDGVVVENTTNKWIKTKRIDVIETGLVKEYFASPTAITAKDSDGNLVYGALEEKKFSKIMITAYSTGTDDIIDINATTGAPVIADNVDTVLTNVASTKGDASKNYANAFVIEGKIIIVY